MEGLPISSAIYIFNASMTFIYSMRQFKANREKRNFYALRFARLSMGVTIAFLLYGLPNLIHPGNPIINGFFYVLAIPPLLLGLNEGLKVAFEAWNLEKAGKFAIRFFSVIIILFFLSHLLAIPSGILDSGLIRWHVDYPYNIVFGLLVLAQALPIGFFLLITRTESKKVIVKKILFGFTFILGGLGGMAVVPLAYSSFSLLLFVGIIFLLDLYLKE